MSEPSVASKMSDIEVAARTIWAEARNGGKEGMENVAQVILNRAKNPRWWGNSVRSVCLEPNQFSCWWVKDINYKRMLAVSSMNSTYSIAWDIATNIVRGKNVSNRVSGADHYYAPAGMNGGKPNWADSSKMTYEAHGHRFYRLEIKPSKMAEDETSPTPLSYIVAPATAAAGVVASTAQAMAEVPWQVGVALIVVVAAGLLYWRWEVSKKERENAARNHN